MRLKAIAIAVALACCATGALAQKADVTAGTWKLNVEKSKYNPPDQTKYETITIANAGDQITMTLDGTGTDGAPVHEQWTGKYDGKPYPVTGSPRVDQRTYKMTNAHTFNGTGTKAGKQVNSVKVVYSADGKTRTVTATGTDDKGQKVSSTAVYDKQ